MYYKYRSLSNLQFALDILVNKRLYAAEFTKLNDPMEGLFTYGEGSVPDWIADALYHQKRTLRILSLCEQPDNMLMWSYYSEGHRGFVVGGDIADDNVKAVSVRYVKNFDIGDIRRADIAQAILSRKHEFWKHEREHRVFVMEGGEPFIPFKIRELIFGVEADSEMRKLLSAIAKKFNPGVKVKTISTSDLNTGAGRFRA